MWRPRSVAVAIPTGETRRLHRVIQRTTIIRVILAAAIVAAAALTVAAARGADERTPSLLPSKPGSMVALDLSGSVGDFPRIASAFRRLSHEDQPTGLVVFSGGAYELLPPGSPPAELGRFARFFEPVREGSDVYARNPWDEANYRGGTSIPSGLELARYALERAGVPDGTILLVSDLDAAGDTQGLTNALVALRRSGYEIRVIPVGALPENQAFFERILGRTALLAEADPATPVQTATERRLGGILPWRFLLLAALVVALLSVNERMLGRLEVGP
jgi:hypothetical protein